MKPELSVFACGDCGKPLVCRQRTREDGKGTHDIYGCSGFPKCMAGYPVKEDGGPDFEKKFGEN